MKIGILTGGGDAPGLNGIIESAGRVLLAQGCTLTGILDGFEGVFDGRSRRIELGDITGLHSQAGTLLGTSNRSRIDGREAEFVAGYRRLGLDGLIVAGGDGTFAALARIASDVPVIGVPKTIDNDLPGTEITFGYDTACAVVAESVDALRSTADAHRRILIVETMGRTAGWIALGGGLASYADAILIPERPFDPPALLAALRTRRDAGRRGLVLVVSESAHAQGDQPAVALRVATGFERDRFGGISEKLARWIEKELDWESRHVILGHLQRARAPTTTDRFLTAALGVCAAKLALEKKWFHAAVYRDGTVTTAPLGDIQGAARRVSSDHRWVRTAQSLGIFI